MSSHRIVQKSNFDRALQDVVPFGAKFIHGAGFQALFEEGMSLVEDTAAYLDGAGRTAALEFDSEAHETWCRQTMMLTSRLMETTSWLLLQKAVSQGELNRADAKIEYERMQKSGPVADGPLAELDLMPEKLRELIARSHILKARIERLGAKTFGVEPERGQNPVALQMQILKQSLR